MTTEPIRHAPIALWRIAGTFLSVLHALFGAPEAVAARHTLTARAHAHMASWLRCAEAMLRRLILIEAGAIAKPNTRPLLTPTRKRVRKLMGFTPDKPGAWRVSFRVFSSPVHGGSVSAQGALTKGATHTRPSKAGARCAPSVACGDTSPVNGGGKSQRVSREERWCAEHRPPVTFRSAWPLAERYEAVSWRM